MEIKLTEGRIKRLKEDYKYLYDSKQKCMEDMAKYNSSVEAFNIIKIDAKLEAIHNILLVLGIDVFYNHEKETVELNVD